MSVDKTTHVYCPNCSTYMGMNFAGDSQLIKHLNSNACATFVNARSKPMTTQLKQEDTPVADSQNISDQVNNLISQREMANENEALKVDNARLERDLKASQKELSKFGNQAKGHTDLIELATCENCGDKALKDLDKKGGAFLHPEFAKFEMLLIID